MTTSSFVGGRGCTFVVDGPEVEILQDSRPSTRVPLNDLLEFAQNHGLRSGEVNVSPLKNYGFDYEYEGKSFVFHIVAKTEEEARARVKLMGQAAYVGELKPEAASVGGMEGR